MDPIIDYRARASGEAVVSRFMSRVYGWMAFGLLITGVVSFVIANSPEMVKAIFGSPLGILFFIAPLGIAIALPRAINRLSVGAATFWFLAYAFLNGGLISFVFLRYSMTNIGQAFMITAGSFGALAIYGAVTKKDLTAMGSFLGMALWGLIISMVVNMFLRSAVVDFGLSFVAVLLFAGLTAYDSQRIKEYGLSQGIDTDASHKIALVGALMLYLDFINLFLNILSLMGGRRRD